MSANPKILEFGQRKGRVRSASIYRKAHRRTAAIADSLSRLGMSRASAELINEAVGKLIELAYQIDPDTDRPANVDSITGMLLIPVPWSSHNYTRWGLQSTEADALRAYMLRLNTAATQRKTRPPVFTYEPLSRRWALNIFDYPTEADAWKWWERFEMSAKVFVSYAEYVRKRRGKVK
jgi:hypothetical protein